MRIGAQLGIRTLDTLHSGVIKQHTMQCPENTNGKGLLSMSQELKGFFSVQLDKKIGEKYLWEF